MFDKELHDPGVKKIVQRLHDAERPEYREHPLVYRPWGSYETLALGARFHLNVFGDDYPTPDGTCIRDYIHVCDLASAHALALEHLLKGNDSMSINLGTGRGVSIKEIILASESVVGKKVAYTIKQRRPGDPAKLVADSQKAKSILQWKPEHEDIHDILKTALSWENKILNKL